MSVNVTPNSVDKPWIKAFATAFNQQLSEFDISVIMSYIVDLAPESVLYFLASQWNVLGVKGWKFADTVDKKRELIRNAVNLNRIIGTPRSIITALNSLGYDDVTIQENLVGAIYDGTYTYNGAINYDQGYSPFQFRVIIGTENLLNLTGQMYLDIRAIIEAWNNLRSWLEGLYMGVNQDEQVGMRDNLGLFFLTGGIFDNTFDNTFD